MKTIGHFEFPENEEEYDLWKPLFIVKTIHSKVLLVAKTRVEGMWACYCTPVPGLIHDMEWSLWETEGTKVEESIARAAFPIFKEIPYAK